MSSYRGGRPASEPPSRWGLGLIIGVAVLVIIGIIIIGNIITSFHAVSNANVCVVEHHGFWRNRLITPSQVRQPGSGVSSIGVFNKQRCYQATQHNYIISQQAGHGDTATVDFIRTPSADGIPMIVDGTVYYNQSTDPVSVADFHRQYGLRTFDGDHPYDNWVPFQDQNIRPSIDAAMSQAIGQFKCIEMNSSCQYVTEAGTALKKGAKVINNNQNLNAVQTDIGYTLQDDINQALRAPGCVGGGSCGKFIVRGAHPYFTNVRFLFAGKPNFDRQIESKITDAIAAKTQVATATLKGDQRVAAAKADKSVADQKAQAIKATQNAYRNNPAQASIDRIAALCGKNGCDPNTLVLGSGSGLAIGTGK